MELAPDVPHPHPFIHDAEWRGVPWEKETAAQRKQKDLLAEGLGPHMRKEKEAYDNATKIFALQERLLDQKQPFALNEGGKKDASKRSVSGPVHPNAKKVLDKKKKAHERKQQQGGSSEGDIELNTFVDKLKLKKLPITITTPIRWVLPRGFMVENLDVEYYLPLCLEGIRDRGDFLGTLYGEIAFEMAQQLIAVTGPRGRLFRILKLLSAPLREALLKAADPALTPSLESSFAIARRALVLLRDLFNCDRPPKPPPKPLIERGGGGGGGGGGDLDEEPAAVKRAEQEEGKRLRRCGCPSHYAEPTSCSSHRRVPLADDSLRGALGDLMFGGKFSMFSFLAGPLTQVMSRVATSDEHFHHEPIAADYGRLIFDTLDDFNNNGPKAARDAIQSSFSGGYTL